MMYKVTLNEKLLYLLLGSETDKGEGVVGSETRMYVSSVYVGREFFGMDGLESLD